MVLQKYTTKSYYHIPKAEDFFFHAIWRSTACSEFCSSSDQPGFMNLKLCQESHVSKGERGMPERPGSQGPGYVGAPPAAQDAPSQWCWHTAVSRTDFWLKCALSLVVRWGASRHRKPSLIRDLDQNPSNSDQGSWQDFPSQESLL